MKKVMGCLLLFLFPVFLIGAERIETPEPPKDTSPGALPFFQLSVQNGAVFAGGTEYSGSIAGELRWPGIGYCSVRGILPFYSSCGLGLGGRVYFAPRGGFFLGLEDQFQYRYSGSGWYNRLCLEAGWLFIVPLKERDSMTFGLTVSPGWTLPMNAPTNGNMDANGGVISGSFDVKVELTAGWMFE